MNFRQLETFYWIAKLGTFAAAADKLNATQSTISARIAQLEDSLQVSLFDRRGRTARLTAQGWALLPYAETARGLWTAIYRDVCTAKTLAGRVRIGVGEIVALSWLPEMLRSLASRHPSLEVEVMVDLTVNLHNLLEAGRLDLAIGVAPHPSPAIAAQNLGRAEMRWAAAPSLGFGGRTVSPEEIERCPIYSLSKNSHLHVHFLEWFIAQNIRRPLIHVCNSLTTMVALTRTGSGIAILPEVLIQSELANGQLQIIEAPLPIDHYDFYVVFERNSQDAAILATVEAALEATTFPRTEEKASAAQ